MTVLLHFLGQTAGVASADFVPYPNAWEKPPLCILSLLISGQVAESMVVFRRALYPHRTAQNSK